MASTTFTLYAKPATYFPSGASAKRSSFTAFIPIRDISGLYSAGVTASNSAKKNWRPEANVPLTDSDGKITAPWYRFLRDISNRKLGGPIYPTLPDLTSFITVSQAQSIFQGLINSALEQQVIANAQSQATLVSVVQNAGLTGAAQIPPVVLAKQETSAPLPDPALIDIGGGGGSGE